MSIGRLLPLIVFVGLLGLFVFGLKQDPDRALPSPLVGKPLPVFELARLDAPDQVVRSDAVKHPLWVFNVWASWCGPCREELPALGRLKQNSSVPIIGLNYKDSARDAKAMLSQFGNPYDYSVVDESGRYGIDLGVYGVPETFIIDASGNIRFKHVGPLTDVIVERDIMPILKAGS